MSGEKAEKSSPMVQKRGAQTAFSSTARYSMKNKAARLFGKTIVVRAKSTFRRRKSCATS